MRDRLSELAVLFVTMSVALGLCAVAFPKFPLDDAATPLGRDFEPFATAARFATVYDTAIIVAGFTAGVTALLARGYRALAALFPIAFAGRLLLEVPKTLIGRARPTGYWLDVPGGPSFPSGHTMTAAAVFGMWIVLAPYIVPPRWVWPVRIGAGVVIAIYGLARLWAGVHWLSDVYGGLVWSAAMLCLVLLAARGFGLWPARSAADRARAAQEQEPAEQRAPALEA